jgi:hypothetical protein
MLQQTMCRCNCGHATPRRALATDRLPNIRWMGQLFTAHLINRWAAPVVGIQVPTRQRTHDTSAKQYADSIHTPASLTLGMQQPAGALDTKGIARKQDTTAKPTPPRPPGAPLQPTHPQHAAAGQNLEHHVTPRQNSASIPPLASL